MIAFLSHSENCKHIYKHILQIFFGKWKEVTEIGDFTNILFSGLHTK